MSCCDFLPLCCSISLPHSQRPPKQNIRQNLKGKKITKNCDMTHLASKKHTVLTRHIAQCLASVSIIRISSWPLLGSAVAVSLPHILYFIFLFVCLRITSYDFLSSLLYCRFVVWWPICWHSERVTFSGLSHLRFSQTSLICIDVYLLPPLTRYKEHLIIQYVWFLYKTVSRTDRSSLLVGAYKHWYLLCYREFICWC